MVSREELIEEFKEFARPLKDVRGRITALKHVQLAFYFSWLFAIGTGAVSIYLYDFSPPSFVFGVQIALITFNLFILLYSLYGIEQIYHYIESLQHESNKEFFNRPDAKKN